MVIRLLSQTNPSAERQQLLPRSTQNTSIAELPIQRLRFIADERSCAFSFLVETASLPMGFDPIHHRLSDVNQVDGRSTRLSSDNRLEIIDFLSSEISGIHCRDEHSGTTTIRIARSALSSLEEFLRVLVHELAHHNGGDGDVRHERAEGRIFSRIVASTMDIPSRTAALASLACSGAAA
jgi:hypothetical protein